MTQNPLQQRSERIILVLNYSTTRNMEGYWIYIVLFLLFSGKTFSQTETTFVTTPKVVEAKLGEQVSFFLTYTTQDNSSEFTVTSLNGMYEVIKIVDTNITTNSSWTMDANVQVSAIDGSTRKVNIMIYIVNFQIHDGDYRVKVEGSDGMGEDTLLIRTIASPDKLQLAASAPDVQERMTIQFTCKGNTGRPRPIVHLLRRDVYNGTSNRTFHPIMSTTTPDILPQFENGTFDLTHAFSYTVQWHDNFAEFRCDISYDVGLGTELSSAQSDSVTINVTSTRSLQIQAQPTIVELGKDGVNIICSVTSSLLTQVFVIQLQRNTSTGFENTASVTGQGTSYQDTSLRDRTTLTGAVSPVSSAFLQLFFPSSNLTCPGDFTEYKCTLSAFDTGLVNQETGPLQKTFRVQPAQIAAPSVRIQGESYTSRRQFQVGTTIQLTCTGQIGSDPSATIRWCAKTADASSFTGLPEAPVHSQASKAGCQYTRSSTITYNLTSSDTGTQFLCESGYSSLCGSGTAMQYVNISIGEETETTPETTEMNRPTTPQGDSSTSTEDSSSQTGKDDIAIIIGSVVGGVVVLVVIILLVYFLVLRRKSGSGFGSSAESSNDKATGNVPGYNGPSNSEGSVYSMPVKNNNAPEKQNENADDKKDDAAKDEAKTELHYADLEIAVRPQGGSNKSQSQPKTEASTTEYASVTFGKTA
ncbi:uncharacterized protein LOC134264962 isoform X2 [Saccostrea cucullata]|uniref:uncharacterized protein LOC134264962 isoform X2 n=1 Tax=Saccostrea cuccullata TaxID=36930 RepID=UPI002ECFDFA7